MATQYTYHYYAWLLNWSVYGYDSYCDMSSDIMGGGCSLPSKFWAVGKLYENLIWKFLSKDAKIGVDSSPFEKLYEQNWNLEQP